MLGFNAPLAKKELGAKLIAKKDIRLIIKSITSKYKIFLKNNFKYFYSPVISRLYKYIFIRKSILPFVMLFYSNRLFIEALIYLNKSSFSLCSNFLFSSFSKDLQISSNDTFKQEFLI